VFEKYGEVAEVFVNKDKGFGFVRMVSILVKYYIESTSNISTFKIPVLKRKV